MIIEFVKQQVMKLPENAAIVIPKK